MQQTDWGPKSGAVAGLGIAGVLMATACVTVVTDPPGRILTGLAAAGLLMFAFGSWRARPKLAIVGDGLVYRGWFRTQTLRRADIALIRITEFRRIGRKTRLLEIETVADRLIVLSRWDLGTDPLTVLDALTDAGFAGR
ncbi:PH domain-containing protein [Mycobacterium sp. shizuoka-1]|uniref:PH domain-containing protein n=1 Tax=Mycobacterium sp. shizuoka-1 TaxID=2039281 RepID=UPI000C06781D|nr:PH domain-containing protein [Mycobacterium sp. shizuoka-1]GAY13992.1 hypothetical protein MSZK_07180 [Mycobacterium sp. shizuoka-1]